MRASVGPIMLYTQDLSSVAAFYRDTLGLPEKSYEPGHSLWLRTEPVEIVLHAPDEWYPPPYEPARAGVLLWIRVEGSLEEWARRLKEKGVEVLDQVRAAERNLILLRDPEGRRIGLYAKRSKE